MHNFYSRSKSKTVKLSANSEITFWISGNDNRSSRIENIDGNLVNGVLVNITEQVLWMNTCIIPKWQSFKMSWMTSNFVLLLFW